MRVDDLAQIPLAYPTDAGIVLARAAVIAAGPFGFDVGWQAHQVESELLGKRQSAYQDDAELRRVETVM